MTVTVKSTIFYDVKPDILVEIHQHSREVLPLSFGPNCATNISVNGQSG
jgi:hypothetical protein